MDSSDSERQVVLNIGQRGKTSLQVLTGKIAELLLLPVPELKMTYKIKQLSFDLNKATRLTTAVS